MNYFKEAVKQKLRFNTSKGKMGSEQLYGESLTFISSIIKSLNKMMNNGNNDDGLSFLDETSTVDKKVELAFNVAKQIYLDKKADNTAKRNARDKKKHNEELDALIARKKNQAMEDLSIEELEKMRMS